MPPTQSNFTQIAQTICKRISNVVSDSIFALQLVYWPSREYTGIQHLPPEILMEIFYFCLPSETFPEPPSMRALPLNVASVCRSWRRLALSLPKLWSRFKYSQDGCIRRVWDEYAYGTLGLWLERSRNRSLSLTLGNQYREWMKAKKCEKMIKYEKEDSELYKEMFRKVLDQQRRWRHIRIDYDFNDPENVLEMEMSHMPVLESLHVHLPVETTAVIINVSRSPRLRSLELSCAFTLTTGKGMLTNLERLHLDYGCRYLRAAPLRVDDILMVIRKAPNLKELSAVVCGGVRKDEAKAIKQINLEALRKLALSFPEGDCAAAKSLLDLFVLPSLRSLRIDLRGGGYQLGLPALLTRSKASLKTFRIKTYAHPHDEILRCLRLSPDLVHLTIETTGDPRNLIRALTINPALFYTQPRSHSQNQNQDEEQPRRNICPKLETLQFCNNDMRFFFVEFADMIASRDRNVPSEGRKRLREVRMRQQDTWFMEQDEIVQKSIEKGLRLVAIDNWYR
ncbi:uncharacterized protein FOMMEDRAFT_170846 [Fomitiporia mediterranea MF3/22]|uniref:uncharacterized protein n=1 Tax=Fomitiporia mediterranea (strain MF3/22) TaxID=694068 RepID=UPI0004408AFA|nr:uncharacterized protein FOMMEDRAFT_170846 [Fomitiporia mediterranea MF3/22]EJC98587.1 hypothetical protein FOMMEDRAFT_170846 [Fomitiporia mediterranea MF3/22]